MARLAHKTLAIDYVPATDCAAGTVVKLGGFVGVNPYPIKQGEKGFIEIAGDYWLPLASGATFAIGDVVYVDDAGQAASSGAIFFGYAASVATAADQEVKATLIQSGSGGATASGGTSGDDSTGGENGDETTDDEINGMTIA